MIEIHSTHRIGLVETGLTQSVEQHGGEVLATSRVGKLLAAEPRLVGVDAVVFTLCFSHLYAPLLRADIRFSAFLPSRISVCMRGESVFLETLAPREYCRLIHRPELEPVAMALEEILQAVMEEAAHRPLGNPAIDNLPDDHKATEDQVNMRAALPQRVDCHGTKVEELAGTGIHDAQGG